MQSVQYWGDCGESCTHFSNALRLTEQTLQKEFVRFSVNPEARVLFLKC